MNIKRRTHLFVCFLAMLLTLILPAQAMEQVFRNLEAEPVSCEPEGGEQISVHAQLDLQQPSKEQIAAKWATVTSAGSTYAQKPNVAAPYTTGELTDDFLESGITYLNYVRFVAGLPEVALDSALNLDAQYGAVLLAAYDNLSHYPPKPADMDKAFYDRGYSATSSSNISARYGYRDQTIMLKSAVEGCTDDNNSLGNLSTAGHRRWLLNPALGKVGFGYAQSKTNWSYIVTKVFDRTGAGCDFDYISWPAAGNHPTNLFDTQNPWTVTLNTSVYKTASTKYLNITVTRESDGKQWAFDKSTGEPNIDSNGKIKPYMTVENSWYGLPNCIIFHPGSDAVSSYEGVYNVKITGITYTNGKAAEISYDVEFFDVNSVSVEHSYSYKVTKEPTVSATGTLTGTCSKCSGTTTVTLPKLNTTDYSYSVTRAATCAADGTGRYTWKTTTYGSFYFDVTIGKTGHSYASVVTEPTCKAQGYTTYTCSKCGDSYVADYTGPVDHSYENGACKWCGEAEEVAKDYSINWIEAYSSLGGNIAVVFKAELSKDLAEDPNAFMRFTYAGKTVEIPVSEATKSGKYHNFYCRIASINMTDDITAQMMVGEEAIGRSATTSLEKYCQYIIKTSKDAKTVNLMKAMLNYGAAAQKMMKYKLDNLANKSLSEADKVLTKVDASGFKHNLTGSEAGIKAAEAMLVLGSETTIRIGFQLTGSKTIDEYTFIVDGVEAEPVLKGGMYRLEVPNIAAHKLDEYHTFTCGDITITYCGLSYVNQIMKNYTEGTTFDMAVALYNYSQATEAFIS